MFREHFFTFGASFTHKHVLVLPAIIPEVSVDPMKVVEDAVLEFTDKKDLFLGYMSSMLGGDQGGGVSNYCESQNIMLL